LGEHLVRRRTRRAVRIDRFASGRLGVVRHSLAGPLAIDPFGNRIELLEQRTDRPMEGPNVSNPNLRA
jgi:hypothetical protein